MPATNKYDFYATVEDILMILRLVEASYHLQYVECGLFNESERPIFHGSSSLYGVGVAQTGESIREPTFLVMLEGDRLNVRPVSQRRGGTKYAIDQKNNPGTVTIRPGGMYKDCALIAGMVGTVHHDKKAEKLMKAISRALKQNFSKTRSYLVGPEAQNLLASGMRLTPSVFAPADIDLSAQNSK